MVCRYFGREYSMCSLSKYCCATTEGVSMLGINNTAKAIGFDKTCVRAPIDVFNEATLPCILHWNQNHFVVLYKVKKGGKFYIADPGKGLLTYSLEEFKKHWIRTSSNGEGMGIAMLLETTPAFFTYKMQDEKNNKEKMSLRFLFGYVKKYSKYFGQIILGLVMGSLLQLILPFLSFSSI
jgi:ATP-binding cassette subfamily B protein